MNTRASSVPPRRSRDGSDAPINHFGQALRALGPAVLQGQCPNCTQAYMFRNWLQVKATCDYCGVRFERDPGSFLVLLGLNYLLAVLVTGIVAAILIPQFGLFDGITPILVGVGLLSLAGFYHAAKALYIWILWLFGFVYND